MLCYIIKCWVCTRCFFLAKEMLCPRLMKNKAKKNKIIRHKSVIFAIYKALKAGWSSPSSKPFRSDWGHVVHSLRDQKYLHVKKGLSFSLWKTRPLGSLNSLPSNSGSPNHLSLLTIFTPWIIGGKRQFQFQSFVTTWDCGGGKLQLTRKKPTGKNQLTLGWNFDYHLSAFNAFCKAVTFFWHFTFSV